VSLLETSRTRSLQDPLHPKKFPNSISSKHIPDVPANADLTPGSVLHLAHLFDKAEKTGRKEKLRWYYLFKGIGIDKIGVVTSSADAISRLTDAQIQNIINLYTDESQKLIGVNNCSRARDFFYQTCHP